MKGAAIDWGSVKDRLRASERAVEHALTPNPQRVRDTFRKRAAHLAKVDAKPQPESAARPALIFRLGQERYAIEMGELTEVVPFARCVPVPGGSRSFLGVINLRGELRAVLDLRNVLAASGDGNGDTGLVLMLRRPGKEIGWKVDRVEELRDIRLEELTPSPHGSCGKGLLSATVTLLDVDSVLRAALPKEESRIT